MRVPIAVAAIVVLFAVGCKKDAASAVAPADAGLAAEIIVDAGAGSVASDARLAVTVEQVDRYLVYRRALTATHKALAPRLDAVEAKGKKKDAGVVAEEGLKLIAEEAKAQEQARVASGLTQAQLDHVEEMVQEMVTEREMAADTASPEDIAEMEAMAKKLPADQKANVEQSIVALRAQRARSAQLTDMRERFGDANVEILLQRDKELLAAWTEWIAVLAGEAK